MIQNFQIVYNRYYILIGDKDSSNNPNKYELTCPINYILVSIKTRKQNLS